MKLRRSLISMFMAFALLTGLAPISEAADVWRQENLHYFKASDGTQLMADESMFASSVVEYDPGNPVPERQANRDPLAALGLPNYVSNSATPDAFVSLSSGGRLVLEFQDAFYDLPGVDICVFEIGPSAETVKVSVSSDGSAWYDVGTISGNQREIDLSSHNVPSGETFRYLLLVDDGGNEYGQPYPGADIDAVCVMPQESDAYQFTDRAGNSVMVSQDSFAKRVAEFIPGSPFTSRAQNQDPNAALGLPDYKSSTDGSFVSLGGSGVLVLEFEQDIIDGEGDDVYIFEVGPSVESTQVEVSPDQSTWYDLGAVKGKTAGLDLNGKIPDGSTVRYVRLTDLRTDTNMPTPGADIDAVCGLNSSSRIHSVAVPKGKYCISVIDENGKPILGANVFWNDQKAATNRYGYALFDLSTVGEPTISVSKSGYDTWTNAGTAWKKSSNHLTTVTLYPAGMGAYVLTSALYSNSSSMSAPTDLLTRVKKLSLKNSGNLIGDLDLGSFYLKCEAANPKKVARYELWQSQKAIASSADGNFGKLSVTQFASGGGCVIRVIGKDGTKRDTSINLEFTENEVVKELEFNLDPGKVSLSIPDTVPYVGGGSVDFKLPLDFKAFPVISRSENKFKFGINVNLLGNDTSAETMEKNNETLKQVKNVLTRLSSSASSAEKGGALRSMKQYMKKETGFKLFSLADDMNIDFMAYIEGDLGSKTGSGTAVLVVEADLLEFGFNTIVVVVPVTVQIGLSVEGQVMGTLNLDLANSTWTGGLDFNITPELTAFGGVGVGKVVGVGAYGSADLEVKTRLLGAPKGLRSIDLTGELGLKAYLGWLEYHRAFAHNTWHLYTANTVNAALSQSGTAWNAGLYDASQYEKSDLSYLQQQSAWLGGAKRSPMLKSVRAANGGAARTEFETLLSDTYRNAQPVAVSSGDRIFGAFVQANLSSGERFVSVTSTDGSVWNEPVRVDETAILDSAPVLSYDGENVWLAYARTTEQPEDSLLNYAQHQEIVVGTINPETLAFTEQAAFPGAGYACMPTLAVVGGAPALAWLDADVTDDDSVLAPPSGTIRTAVWNGSAWSESDSAFVNAPVTQVILGDDGAAYVANDTLYSASGAVLGSDVKGSVQWCAVPGTDHSAFVWNGEDALLSSAGDVIPAADITAEYAVVGNDVYYSAASDTGANLAVVKYVDGVYSAPILMTDGDRYLENLSAAELNGEVVAFGMNTRAEIWEDAVEDAKDLVWTRVVPVNDLIVQAIEYDEVGTRPGDEVPVTVTVYNAGDHTAEAVELWLDGELVSTSTDGILPGQSADLTLTQICPEGYTTYDVEVRERDLDDFSEDNNRVSFGLGYADVSLSLTAQSVGGTRSMLAYLVNEGIDTAGGSVVFYDEAGTVLGIGSYKDLTAGDAAVVECVLPASHEDWEGTVTAMISPNQAERNLANNSASCDTALLPSVRITQHPQDFTGAVGETATFTVIAAGDGLTYRWQYKDADGSAWQNSSFKTPSMTCKITAERDGRQYRCIITDARGNRVTSAAAVITVKAALAITQQPQDFTGAVGETATFTVQATGDGLTYQWQYQEPGGSTWLNSSFKTPSMTCKITAARDGRQYRCIVTDASNQSVTSEPAAIIVKPALAITQQPQDFTGAVGETATFTVKAMGEGLTYQWQYKDVGGSWANSSFITPSMSCKLTAARDGRQYRCIVQDANENRLISDAATITVRPALAITQQPQNFAGAVGETATFTVKATGEGLTYRWQYKDVGGVWTNSSFRAATMSCKLTEARDGRQYRCVITDVNNNKIYSDAATMTVKKTFAITQQPQDFTGKVGETATFSVTAVGDGLTYQWQYKDVGGSWANSSFKTPSMTCKITAARDGRQYRCIVTDASGSSVTSSAAAIRVTA